ncbi:MAG: hypothetical protein JST30_15290 [Armatimonadetes bacterium]|nr:hypothetical protein [Armatimonadota bacterium]
MTPLLAVSCLIVPPVSWSGTPRWVPDDVHAARVRTVFHKVDVTLSRKDVTYRVKTLFKSTGDRPLKGRIIVPVIGDGGDTEFFKTGITATWGGISVPRRGLYADPNVESRWSQWWDFPVSFQSGEWKAFESTLTRPLPKGGQDLVERFVRFTVFDQDEALEQFQFSVKYPKGFVFHTVSTSPKDGWQIGDQGAFWKRDGWRPTGDVRLEFRFYPNTFETIGG